MSVVTKTPGREGPSVRKVRAAIFMALLALGLAPSHTANADDSAVILMYHRFAEARYPTTNIRAEQFEAHLNELAAGDYRVLPLEDIVAALREGRALPDRAVAITIDDANASAFEVARPLLKTYGMPYTVFVSTESVDQYSPGYMTWDQLRILRDEKVAIGHHSVSHLHMVEATPEEIRAEIAQASQRFRSELGFVPKLFAYPYGEFGLRERALVSEAGFSAAFGQYSGVANAKGDPFALPRFALNEHYGDMERFRMIVNALPLVLENIAPADPVLAPGLAENPPQFSFNLTGGAESLSSLACYASHIAEKTPLERGPGGVVRLHIKTPFPPGRGRINCTAQAADDRWLWVGIPIYVRPVRVRDGRPPD